MIQILNITVRNESGRDILFSHYPEDQVIVSHLFESYRSKLIKYYSDLFDQPVKLDILRRQKQDSSKTPMDVLKAYCEVFEVDSINLLGRSRNGQLVDHRMYINQICVDEGFRFAEIEEHLWKDRIFYHYKKRFNNFTVSVPNFLDDYEEIRSKTVKQIFK